MGNMTDTTFTERPFASFNDFVANNGRRVLKGALMAGGSFLVLAGIIIAPLPGPFGLPIAALGLVIMLRNSYAFRRTFVRFQRKYPRFVYPVRRLMRKNPEILPVAWQQALRLERAVLPKSWRKSREIRRRWFSRRRAAAAA